MAADSTVNIDVILHKDQAQQSAKELDQALKDTGKDAGDKAEKNIEDNVQKASEKTKELVTNINRWVDEKGQIHIDVDKQRADESIEEFKERVKRVPKKPKVKPDVDTDSANEKIDGLQKKVTKIPEEVRTELVAQAKEQGITNFDQLLKKIPKRQLTELIAKAQKGEVINYEELLHKLPAKLVTEVKLNDRASLPLKELQRQANETGHSFSHLKEIIAGSFVGGLAVSGIHAIGNGLRDAAKAGMEYNVEQDRMKTVWTALTTEAPKDGKTLVNFINDMAQHSIYAAGTIDRMAQSFYHVHSSVKETKDWTTAFVRLGSTLHMSNDQLAEAGEQFSKIVAGGKANAEDMSVMINRFPMFGEALQKATGKSMKQLYEMSAKGKLTAKEFTEALDYLSNKYKNSTEEAMTSFTGMSMYIKQRWSVLWGEVTQEGFKGSKKLSEDLRDILSDKMIAKYAEILGDALGTIMRGVVGILNYIGQHKDTIVDLTGNLIKIVALIGETVWQTFGDFLKIIGSMFGIVGKNGKAAVDPLELLDDITKALVAHEGAVKALTQAFIALFAVKRIMNFIMWLSKAKEALVSFEVLQRGMNMMGFGGTKAPSTTVPANPQYLTPQSAELNAGRLILPRLNNMSGAMNVLKANKGMPIFTAAAGVGTELMSTNNTGQKVGGSIGSVAGTALGAFAGSFMGPMGTAVGSMAGEWLGKKIGESAGNAANKAMAGHSIVAHTKVKIDADTSGSSNAVRPDLNKVARTVIKMSVDPKSIADTKQKTDKLYSDMSKSLEKYYSDKEKRSQKDLQELVKEGVLTQKQADSKLTAEKNADKRRIKEQQATISTMQRDTNNHYKRLESIENGGTKRLQQIAQKYGQNSKKYNQERIKELEKENKRYSNELVKDQMKNDRAIQASVKKGASQQEKIYKDLIKRKGTLSLQDLKQTQKDANKQYEATVKPAKKARDEVIKDANDRYKKTTDTARREWKKNGTISKKQYEEIKNNAEKQKDDTVKAAKDQYNGVTKKASDQHKKVSDEINRQKNDVIAAANGQATGHISASQTEMNGVNGNYSSGYSHAGGIWNKFLTAIKNVLKFFQQNSNVPTVPTGYAIGTGALTQNQIAMVGEEGPELANTPNGYEMLGINGPEIRYLSAGTSILTHAQTKTAMALNGGKIPGYAKGTGAKVEDFVDGLKDGAEDALDLLGKGASEVWDWLKQKTGLDSMLSSQRSMGGVKRTTHGTFDYAKNSISNYIKKIADKFLESFSGGQGKMSKGAFAQAAKVAAALMHQSLSASDIERLYWQAMVESTVNPAQGGGIDDHDGTGRPIGLFQFKLGTWGAAVRHLPSGHSNIHSAVNQIMAVLADRTWRSDLAPIGVRRGWSPHGYANGGWADKLSIFGEVPGEPELAINPARDTSEDHIAEAIEARAKVNPNGFAGNLSKIINEAKQSANNMLPFISTGNNHVQATSNVQSSRPRVDGNITLTMNIDGKQLSRAVYPTLKAMRSHEVIINGVGGAVPVGNGQPLGGVY
ncbi:tape measure protein [Limosilactobacillus reuteri]|uniref:tape measure protein n=1 Tax=Limosilactobacillus reuteri TaxID=1598 RepID=UPI001E48FFD3|nr:tape measure protein [Limosilactobacillus reuteri]MCC4346113.1 tape measure protein [Limosilactobacillus reuteri]